MQALQSSRRLQQVASTFSAHAAARLARIRRETSNKLAQEKEARKKQKREAEAKRATAERLLAQRLPLARKGLERILAFGRSKEFDGIFNDYSALTSVELQIVFFGVSRPSGDDWDFGTSYGASRDAEILLLSDRITIRLGGLGTGLSDSYDILYKPGDTKEAPVEPESTEHRVLEEGGWTMESLDPAKWLTINEFLKKIASAYSQPIALYNRPSQRRYEWDPEDVAFQVMVSCARKSAFEVYSAKCLSNLEKELRELRRP